MNLLPAATFITFDRTPSVFQGEDSRYTKDNYEIIADSSLHAFREAFGYKSVTVYKTAGGEFNYHQNDNIAPRSLYARINSIVLALILAPVIIIGCFLLKYSISHQKMHRKFLINEYTKNLNDLQINISIKDLTTKDLSLILKAQVVLETSSKPNFNRPKFHELNFSVHELPDGKEIQVLHKNLKAQKEATANNSTIASEILINDIWNLIFGELTDPEDALSVMLTCQTYNRRLVASCVGRVTEHKRKINEITNAIEFLDKQIDPLTNGQFHLIKKRDNSLSRIGDHQFFQFDLAKVKRTVENLTRPVWAFRACELVETLRLDAIESLAEYNISSQFIEEFNINRDHLHGFVHFSIRSAASSVNDPANRFIHKLVLPDGSGDLLKGILNSAKETLKGKARCQTVEPFTYHGRNLDYLTGPFAEIVMSNPENENWRDHYYSRMRANSPGDFAYLNYLPIQHLVGINDGGRLVIKQGGVPIFLRFVDTGERISMEDSLIRDAFKDVNWTHYKNQEPLKPQLEENYRRAREKFIQIYGQERIDAVVESEKKYSEEWENRFKK